MGKHFMDDNNKRIILHCDLNSYFASVEALERPELKGLPLAVCGSVEERHGIVLARSEQAKNTACEPPNGMGSQKNSPSLTYRQPEV